MMRLVSSSPSDPFDFRGVQRAYDTAAEDYATRLPDTRAADQVASQLEAAGLREVCRLVRRAQGMERDDQAVLLAKVQ
jgi:hypothetical protein